MTGSRGPGGLKARALAGVALVALPLAAASLGALAVQYRHEVRTFDQRQHGPRPALSRAPAGDPAMTPGTVSPQVTASGWSDDDFGSRYLLPGAASLLALLIAAGILLRALDRRGQSMLAHATEDLRADLAERDRRLALMEDANRTLARELHHRVKNSLQVIQSYLSLSRRENRRAPVDPVIAMTEARVLVLANAYRLALSDEGLQSVSIRSFAEAVVGFLAETLGIRGENIQLDGRCDEARLPIDRMVPFGLAIVEAAGALVRAGATDRVMVTVDTGADDHLHLRVHAQGVMPDIRLPLRLLAGLAQQLDAEDLPPLAGDVLHWRFQPS